MQCQKFNDRWTFEKVDQDDRLKAFYGDDNKIIVTLPYDAMIREKEIKSVRKVHRVAFILGEFILMKNHF